ncbi:tetratricopeptide repeat protein [Glycomyces artemisiae]|uniref:NB-ARC domain-containing protein n=1 Tax=Glycomyces artemisiae TaxID=1076443 RepID=A0A2T0UH57_9ACTN|nr:tetratricopeptide repeat protein [Glycomyces artemisiae]PRY57281.1 NB-ARC domain-containing protein [Glycomyces artemisiae]
MPPADTAARLAAWLAAHMEHHRLSADEVARELRVGAGQVRAWLAAAGHRPPVAAGEFDHLDTPVKLGAWLRARIADSGLTVRELAASTEHVSMSTVYNWLKGEHLPAPPAADEPDRFDLLLSNPALGLGIHQRVQLDEVRRRLTGTSLHVDDPAAWDARALPAANRSFTGRRAALRRLDRALADRAALVLVTGIGGVGKTALAVQWARSALARATYTDGCLYLDLHGYSAGPPVDADTARLRLLYQLGVDPRRLPSDTEAQAALYQRILADRRVLLVLDNAHGEPQVRPLLPAAPGCLALVTGRGRLTGLDVTSPGLARLDLDALADTEATALLRDLLGRLATKDVPDADVQALADRCGRLPLAIQIAAADYLTHHHPRRTSLADYTADLALGALATGPDDPATAVTPALDHSHRRLSPGAQRAYRLLGLHRAPDFAPAWAASVVAEPLDRARALLSELAQANLLAVDDRGRYAFHDLLREHAAALADRHETAEDRRAAVGRGLDHWRAGGIAATMAAEPGRDPIVVRPLAPGVTPEVFDDYDAAARWIDDELEGLLAGAAHAAEAGFDADVWQFAWTAANVLGDRGQWSRQIELARLSLEASQRAGDTEAIARSHRFVAHPAIRDGRVDEARTHLRSALDLHRADADAAGQAAVLHSLAAIEEHVGDYAAALACAETALAIDRDRGFLGGQGRALNEIGWHLAHLGRAAEAVEPCLQALAVFEKLGDRGGAALTLDTLGYIRHAGGEHDAAIAEYRRANAEFRALGRPFETAGTLDRIGDVHADAGDRAAARAAWGESLALFEELGHAVADEVRAKLEAPE